MNYALKVVKTASVLFNFIAVQLPYNVVFVSGVQQSECVCVCVCVCILFSCVGYYTLLSRFPCAMQ